MYVIYALVDPRDNTPRYVGMTKDVYSRFTQHLRCDGTSYRKDAWLQELKVENRMVIMQELQIIETLSLAQVREAYWIRHYLGLGITLYNNQVPSPLRYRVEEEPFQAPPDDELVKAMLLEKIPLQNIAKAFCSGTTNGRAYQIALRELADSLLRLVKPPSNKNTRPYLIYSLLKQGVSHPKIIRELWGDLKGKAYDQALNELRDYLASMVMVEESEDDTGYDISPSGQLSGIILKEVHLSPELTAKMLMVLEMDSQTKNQNDIINTVWGVNPDTREGRAAKEELKLIRSHVAQHARKTMRLTGSEV